LFNVIFNIQYVIQNNAFELKDLKYNSKTFIKGSYLRIRMLSVLLK
jgi:hypothetical protein